MNALNLKKHIALHGDKEVWATLPRADFSLPVVACCSSCSVNFLGDRGSKLNQENVLGITVYPEQVETNKGLIKVHGITLRQLYQDAVDSRKHRMFARFCDHAENPTWEINRFEIHDDWIELA